MANKGTKSKHSHRFCVAPMMDWTDRYDRYFLRLISRHAMLYTAMVTTGAIIHGDRHRLLSFEPEEHLVALQLGGSDPSDLADCARIAEQWGFDEINLNVGCPSDRVQSGRFGACLMAQPQLVAECIAAMGQATRLPVTVKCRIGIDDQDAEQALFQFVEFVAAAGCHTFIVHARKAWLDGLSAKQNRDVPPLDYQLVYRLKETHPDLEIVINGGIQSLDMCERHLDHVDGVMLGRAAYQTPFLLSEVDNRFFGSRRKPPTRAEIVEAFLPYAERKCAEGVPLYAMARHLLGLFHGVAGAKRWRRHISEHGPKPGAGPQVIREALACVEQAGVSAAA